ncbi:PREDICTED: uncharacterized protein LOC104816978 isoform X1 [Tarenaya hassleriana]|uniref:uncharacterized protein LOC104816978 isoform X1 n=1 Tax=Tarenaya hassleriana TaxID=28532 RepID=UPI00053C71AB|nr:PREDICTED: uncharacterized protein LOC104816978 isoform X1 [Tarenaya hassleriana]
MAPRLRSSLAPPSPSILGAPPQNHRRRSSTPPPPLSVNPSPLQQAEISLAGSLKKQQKDAQVTLSGTSQSQTKQAKPSSSIYQYVYWVENATHSEVRDMPRIIKFLLQVTLYELWKERNHRIFRRKKRTLEHTRWKIDRTIRTILISIKGNSPNDRESILADWYYLTRETRR